MHLDLTYTCIHGVLVERTIIQIIRVNGTALSVPGNDHLRKKGRKTGRKTWRRGGRKGGGRYGGRKGEGGGMGSKDVK